MKLKELDLFARKETDDSTRTWLGVLLSFVFPVALLAYLTYIIYTISKDPPVVESQTQAASSQLFGSQFMCIAPQGCYMTLSYSNNSIECYNEIFNKGSNYLNKCTLLQMGEIFSVDFCYSSDPNDGLSFAWKRAQSCTLDGTNIMTDCRSAIILQSKFLDITDASIQNNSVPIFNGIHVFTVTMITESLSNPAKASTSGPNEFLQISPVQVSTDSNIDNSSNICCNSAFGPEITCANEGNPGTANDGYVDNESGNLVFRSGLMYQAQIRTFPIYTSLTISAHNILSEAVTAGGSFYSAVMAIFAGVVFMYRLIANKLVATAKVSSPSSAVGVMASKYI